MKFIITLQYTEIKWRQITYNIVKRTISEEHYTMLTRGACHKHTKVTRRFIRGKHAVYCLNEDGVEFVINYIVYILCIQRHNKAAVPLT